MSEVVSPAISGQWTQFWSTSYGSASVQPMRRSAHSTIVFEDNLYVFGGISTNAANEDIEHNDTWVFDLVNRQWAEVLVGENRPTSRFHHAGLLHTNSAMMPRLGVAFQQCSIMMSGGCD
ncbi:kelch repeat protein [Plasmopara halstedii]|uniref:Kelch repeat protein n=1 Tax=Plasmopara halstedii TaxID=4781 RepID=A0A0P1A7P5_PLAHL|nr:kelch repeat protein [Plasmopara halstedii]CEG36505.1 kelch repeat protein [Plasmopara halstedii]|eukprot:XP_024572874.1 kelch repeat protein [Plasmopara halstedii]